MGEHVEQNLPLGRQQCSVDGAIGSERLHIGGQKTLKKRFGRRSRDHDDGTANELAINSGHAHNMALRDGTAKPQISIPRFLPS
jgi:hypothetical protein